MYGILHSVDKWLEKVVESDIIRILTGKKVLQMSDREKVYQLLDIVPDYKIGYVVAYLQGITEGEDAKPNAETLAAMKELEDGGGECFDTLDELWASLEE